MIEGFRARLHLWAAVILLLGGIFAVSSGAHATMTSSLGSMMTFERATNGRAIDTRLPWALRGGYRFGLTDFEIEYSSFATSQGTAMVQVKRERQEVMFWVRRTFASHWPLKPYLSGALGLLREQAETVFGSAMGLNVGEPTTVFNVALGARAQIASNLEIDLGPRFGISESYVPNPQLSFSFFISWIF